MRTARFWPSAGALLLGLFAAASTAAAHVVISPTESPPGATQLYTLAVPSEKQSNTVRLEVQFPRDLVVLQLEAPAGWRVAPENDTPGHIAGAVWDGGSVPPNQFVELGVLAQNPDTAASLSWSVIQTYADGSEVQWIGPETAQFPATVTRVRTSGVDGSIAEWIAMAAALVACISLAFTLYAWRKLRTSADARQRRMGWHGAGVAQHRKSA